MRKVISANDIHIMLFRGLVHNLEHVNRGKVVRLDDADIFATSQIETLIHRVSVAAIGLGENHDARIAASVLFNHGKRSIRRTVIEADDFNVLKSLIHEAVETLAQIALDVANRNKNRDGRV